MMKFLVIGGAGYIGSHFLRVAERSGHTSVVYDNLSRGHRAAVPSHIPLVVGDISDRRLLKETLKKGEFDTVFHFAAYALVGESVAHPDMYYANNAEGLRVLLEAMRQTTPATSLVFSSTCAVFGVPERLPLYEDAPKCPISPYGRSKLVDEWMMEDYARAYGLKAMALRYFNACGADETDPIGEDHEPETHLIPNVIKAALRGETVSIFGSDFPTPDGTCIRDYIHVTDLADAHIRAATRLKSLAAGHFDAINLGTGQGLSNLEIVKAVGDILGSPVAYSLKERRPGDPPALFTDNRKAREVLGFTPRHSSIEHIIKTALKWHRSAPNR